MGCRLGCSPEYEATITYRGGDRPLMTIDPESITWGRVQDNYSEARVEISSTCCGKLADVEAWAHELHIARNGDEVWCGPVLIDASCRSGTTIIARDLLWWLNRRVIHSDHISASQGAVDVARELIFDGYGPDDPNVLPYLDIAGVGVLGGREYLANSKYVLDVLRDLARGSIDFTAIGRRIVVRRQGTSLGRTALLTCESFQGNVCATQDGSAAATRGIVTGDLDADPNNVGIAGGVDPYYGLIEVLQSDTSIKSAATAAGHARGIVDAGNPPPLLVQPPDDSALAADAPVCMHELVPGVTVPVVLDCTCRKVSQDMRLLKLDVSWSASTGESARPLLRPVFPVLEV